MLWHTQLWFSLHYLCSITSKLLPVWVCTNCVSIHLCAHRADQALTTLAMRKFCEDKVSSSIQPSQNRCGTLPLNFLQLLMLLLPNPSSASPSSGTSTTSAAFCPAPSKWTAAPCSSTRSSFHRCRTSKQEAVSFSRRLALHVALVSSSCWQSYVSVSAGFFPFLKIYQSLQLVYTSGV